MAPFPHQVGEVRVGFGQGRGPGLLESVKKSLMLLSKGKIKSDAQDTVGLSRPPEGAMEIDVLGGDEKWYRSLSGWD